MVSLELQNIQNILKFHQMILFNQVRHHTHNYDAQFFQMVRKVLYSYFVYRLTGSTHVVSSGAKFFLSSFFFFLNSHDADNKF